MEVAEGRCLERAARQDGVIHREQVLSLGLTEEQIEVRLRTGRWAIVFRSVYRIEGSPRGWLQSLRAAALWARRNFAISHRAAAALMKLARFPEGPVELSLTCNRRPPPGAVIHRVTELRERDLQLVRGLRATSAARTLVELCATEPLHTLEATADEMLRRRLTTLEKIEGAVARAPRRGVSFLRDLLGRYRDGERPAESELEARAMELIDNAGLPRPIKQVPIDAGGHLYRLDMLYPSRKVVIEADSFLHHSDPGASERDRLRRNALTSRGFRVLHWTWNAIRNEADQLASDLARALEG
jgi:very-short-patch-repair endonuclease